MCSPTLETSGPVCLPDIAGRQGISLSYLEQLFTQLRRRGLVRSSRGRGGGYQLGCPASELTIAKVVDALGEGIDTTRCHGKSNCQQGSTCLSHHLWMDLSSHIHDFLDGISVADIVARRRITSVMPQSNLKDDLTRILARNL